MLSAGYQTDDLKITTMYDNPERTERYEDAGVEYIREVTVLSDRFCTYQGIRLGDASTGILSPLVTEWESSGTPYMVYSMENGIVTGLRSSAFSEISALKERETGLLSHAKE